MNKNQMKYLEYLRKENCSTKDAFECSMCDLNYFNEAANEILEYYDLNDKEFWQVMLTFSKEVLNISDL
ncbi:hypothetical protein [Enterococcus sp. N249-2]